MAQMTPINNFDQEVSETVDQAGHYFSLPFQIMGWGLDKLKNPVSTEQQQPSKTSQIIVIGKKTLEHVRNYHNDIFQSSLDWADSVKNGTVTVVELTLYPLKFSKIGLSIRRTLSEKIMGNITRTLAFCAFQFFHILPYVFPVALTAGTLFLYYKATVGMITILAGSILIVQIFLIWQLVVVAKETNKILERNTEVFHSVQTLGARILKGIRWTSTCWIPQRAIDRLKKFELMKYLY
ncbi:MAG: hypothetical protein K1000chlam2_01753 [Chlamydiae bacterium]|nr:hypothetical protein [Chlamydiota bacterium]